jgi:hypothetical protein
MDPYLQTILLLEEIILHRSPYRKRIASNGRMTNEEWIVKDLEGSDHFLIGILSLNFPGRTEENNERSQSQVAHPRFEPSISEMQVYSLTHHFSYAPCSTVTLLRRWGPLSCLPYAVLLPLEGSCAGRTLRSCDRCGSLPPLSLNVTRLQKK